MATQLFKEALTGPYNGVAPPTLLPPGSICAGKNVRRANVAGGWKPRKGVAVHNTTAIAAESVLSLHQFTHPIQGDYHFLAQCDGKIYAATNKPPETGTTFGTELCALASSTTPGFSTAVNDFWAYVDGSGGPVIWGGDFPSVFGFVVSDNGEDSDVTREVVDNNEVTYAVIPGTFAEDSFYFCSPEPADGVRFKFISGQVNAENATLTVKAWRSGAWVAVSDLNDGTAEAGKTLAKDGTVSWTRGSDEIRVISGIAGYWYQVTWSANLTANVQIHSCCVTFPPTRLTNKWNGVYEPPLSVRFYDASEDQFVDYSGKVLIEAQSIYLDLNGATTSDFIYLKTVEPVRGIGFGVVDGTGNSAAAKVDDIEVWTDAGWTSVSGIIDETLDGASGSSFAQTGTIWFDPGTLLPRRKIMDFDSLPGFWYRVSWDVALGAEDIHIYLVSVAAAPEALQVYDGCIEFKGRLFLWGDKKYPNRLRYSSVIRADCFSGRDSGYTPPFGDSSPILVCVRFYNELMVIKERSIWLLEGFSPETFGILKLADTIGACSPQAVAVVEAGSPAMKGDETLTVVGVVSQDGFYLIDGRKPRKVTEPVEHYFNPEFSTCIEAGKMEKLVLFTDNTRNEFHILIPRSASQGAFELVYNHVSHEWYPAWERVVGGAADYFVSGTQILDTDGRFRTYGGNTSGRVFLLESGTADRNAAGEAQKIPHSIKTRAISFDQKMPTTLSFTFLKLILEGKQCDAAGVLVVEFFKNLSTTGSALANPSPLTLKKPGYSLVTDGLTTNQTDCACFQIDFSSDVINSEMEIWSFLYSIDLKGEIVV